jgi:hypothetical protein
MKTKKCSKCKQVLSIVDFSKNKSTKDGLQRWCRACRAVAAKYYRQAHPGKVREQIRRWCEAHPEKIREQSKRYRQAHLERCREIDRRYRQAHPEKVCEKDRRYRQAHLEEVREKNRRWRQANPGKVREYRRKRRAFRRAVAEHFTAEQERFVMAFQHGICALCGQDSPPLHIDHWRPLSKGYSLTLSNAVVLCASCNCQKQDCMPEELYPNDLLARVAAMLAEQEKVWNAMRGEN